MSNNSNVNQDNKHAFFKQLSKFSLSTKEEESISILKSLKMNNFNNKNNCHYLRKVKNLNKENSNNKSNSNNNLIKDYLSYNFKQKNKENINELETKINNITILNDKCLDIHNKLSACFTKLINLLDIKNSLTDVLFMFNNDAKTILNDQDKNNILISKINLVLKNYTDYKSIAAFISSDTDKKCVVESSRFFNDYETADSCINFFKLNQDYLNSEALLKEYKSIKAKLLNKYTDYCLKNISFNEMSMISNSFLVEKELIPNNVNSKLYSKPYYYDKLKKLQVFFCSKEKYDYEVEDVVVNIKKKYVYNRCNLIRPFINEMFNNINIDNYNTIDCSSNNIENINNNSNKESKNIIVNINNNNNKKSKEYCFIDLFKLTICEIIYFKSLFFYKLDISNNKSTQNINININIRYNSSNLNCLEIILKNEIFESLYNFLRPKIVLESKIDVLGYYFDLLLNNFEFFFIDEESISNKPEYLNLNQNPLVMYFKKLFNIEIDVNLIKEIQYIIHNLVNPLIIKIFKDIQEKLIFEVSLKSKNNNMLFDIEDGLYYNYANYEEYIINTYINNNSNCKEACNIYHPFIKKTLSVFYFLVNKLDKDILNSFAISYTNYFINELLDKDEFFNQRNKDSLDYIIQYIIKHNNMSINDKVEDNKENNNNKINKSDAILKNYSSVIKHIIVIEQLLALINVLEYYNLDLNSNNSSINYYSNYFKENIVEKQSIFNNSFNITLLTDKFHKEIESKLDNYTNESIDKTNIMQVIVYIEANVTSLNKKLLLKNFIKNLKIICKLTDKIIIDNCLSNDNNKVNLNIENFLENFDIINKLLDYHFVKLNNNKIFYKKIKNIVFDSCFIAIKKLTDSLNSSTSEDKLNKYEDNQTEQINAKDANIDYKELKNKIDIM